MVDFIQEYFVNPIIYQDKYPPYNVYNTLAYAAIAIAAVYLLYRLLKSKGFVFDGAFFKSIIPFVVFGSLMRIGEDGGILPRVVEISGVQVFPFVTPGIYIVTFLLLLWTWFLAKKTSSSHAEFCEKTLYAGFALIALSAFISLGVLLRLQNPAAFVLIAFIALAIWFAFKRFWQARGLEASFAEQTAVFSQVLDGSATFVGVQFLGYSEQHIVGNAVFSLFGGPWAFLLVKIIFAFGVVELLRRENANEEEKNFILLLITILGLAPGLRDALRILAGI